MKDLIHMLISPASTLMPKSDGRIEIPRRVVFMMGWNREKDVRAFFRKGEVVLSANGSYSDTEDWKLAGKIKVSMDRVRIPLSFLQKAGLGRSCVNLLPCFGTTATAFVAVRRNMSARQERLKIWASNFPEAAGELELLLAGSKEDLLKERLEPSAKQRRKFSELRSKLSEAKKESVSHENAAEPKLLVPPTIAPVVIRVLGRPYVFYGSCRNSSGRYSVFLDGVNGKDSFFLVPVLRKNGESWDPAFLLARDLLIGRLGTILREKLQDGCASEKFDIVLWSDPGQYDGFKVYNNPPDPLPEEVVERGRKSCSDIESFIRKTFKTSDMALSDYTLCNAPAYFNSMNFKEEHAKIS